MDELTPTPSGYLSDPAVCRALGNDGKPISRSTLHKLRKTDPDFPPAIQFVPQRNSTDAAALAAYMDRKREEAVQRAEARRAA